MSSRPSVCLQAQGIKSLSSLREPHICLDGHSIERVDTYKCVGVQVDETLSWEAQISEVVSKVVKVLAAPGGG